MAGANLLFSCSAPFSQAPTATVPSLLLPGLGSAEFSPYHHHTFAGVVFFFPPFLPVGFLPVRDALDASQAHPCAPSSPSTLPATPAGQTNSPGTHPCRTDNSSRPREPQGSFGGELKLYHKAENPLERFLLQQGQNGKLELVNLAITEILGGTGSALVPQITPTRHSSGKHCSPEPLKSFRLHREPRALMSPGCHQHTL